MPRIPLKNITLCAASDVAIPATIGSMRRCLAVADFHEALFFTSKTDHRDNDPGVTTVAIPPLGTREHYSRFILADLAQYIKTDFALVVQWDGFIVDPLAWTPKFLEFDYIGAPWLDCAPPMNVGNGGFSLRSKRLLEVGSEPWFQHSHPEDLCICHQNRQALEDRGIRIADVDTARRFSREREPAYEDHFGIHGIFAIADIMDREELEDYLSCIEIGTIGKRELLDTLKVLRSKGIRDGYAVRRCANEFIRRFPLSRHSVRLFAHLF